MNMKQRTKLARVLQVAGDTGIKLAKFNEVIESPNPPTWEAILNLDNELERYVSELSGFLLAFKEELLDLNRPQPQQPQP